ncbi:hybrid sensor histidine kinase/response regulator [Calothrix sp. UHCC 0171]|uniref:hybrid sensor histidine kinase/response regulator n=1 Tax=Calothrix sp. UHCC 0171 TaxID=3110245 RepID=UPI002B215657|nr:hybrid sensor histidine kinase/response regulator [Calothrix sp. UHCC 0171]MEA5573311.1 hybrid sensor histidine kinase/response regulator [Calothrix sp. UHCC 0171]
MITDDYIREQGYIYFLTEAPELLQTIAEELYDLANNFSIAKVHNLMRATHTIKGGAANVGLNIINKIAHSLEDIFKALYVPEVIIDSQLQTLLFKAFECLQSAITAEITQTSIDNNDLLQRATSIFAQLQGKLGNVFGTDVRLPTSEELGFDIVLSIFETGVSQRIDNIAAMLKSPPSNEEIAKFMRSQAAVFIGLAESLNLPGFEGIAQTIIAALDANPHQALAIAKASLASLEASRQTVLDGDRDRGGEPNEVLLRLTQAPSFLETDLEDDTVLEIVIIEDISNSSPLNSPSLRNEVEELYHFLRTPNSILRKPLKSSTAKYYLKIIRYILGWFNHELEIHEKELSLSLLVPKRGVESTVEYIDNWLGEFWLFLHNDHDSYSLSLYRQGIILNIVLLVAKFKYANDIVGSPVITSLQEQIKQLAQEYKNHPPVNNSEKNWIDNPKLQKLLEIKQIDVNEFVEIEVTENVVETISEEDINSTLNDSTLNNTILAQSGLNYIQDNTHEYLHIQIEDSQSENDESITIVEQRFIEDVTQEIAETIIESKIIATTNINQEIGSKNHITTNIGNSNNTNKNNLRQHTFVRVDIEELQRLHYLVGELLIYQKRSTLQDEQIKELIEQLSQQISRHRSTLSQLEDVSLPRKNYSLNTHKNTTTLDFDTLEIDKDSDFHLTLNSAFEETLQLQETSESIDLILRQSLLIHEKKQNITRSIIDTIVETRMSPLGKLLNRFPQMVANLANLYGKKVEMKLIGTQVLIDKAISEKLYDPLLHIVRNAFDHGIETPNVRQKQGKPDTGVIEICAYHQGNQTIIEVSDDGQGLNFERIHQKGTEQGLIPNNHHPSKEELLELLFSPGFSTANQVSEISGRGIGLDIVKTQIQALKGAIAISSKPNAGTKFLLRIPFSMTTDKLMIVQAGGAIYALLLDSIAKILLPANQQIKEFDGKKVIYWKTDKDERMIGLRNLADLIHYGGSFVANTSINNKITPSNQKKAHPVLVLQRNQEIIALEVDQIVGEQELVIHPLGSAIAPPKYVYGCTSLANGSLILVIDGLLLTQTSKMQTSLDVATLPVSSTSTPLLSYADFDGTAETEVDTKVKQATKTILVVDDAISLRQTVSLTLEKAGYQVIQAQHGIEALEKLQHHPEIQLIISDLEMPCMSGLELLSKIRQNSSLSKKPIIILTSRSAEKHQKLAEGLGANAYVTKPYLENEFLVIINDLINKHHPTSTNVFAKISAKH